MLCLTGLYLIVSVLATNLPLVTTALVADTNWSAVVSLPMRVVAPPFSKEFARFDHRRNFSANTNRKK
jgi:hypothetical protein